MNMIYTWVIYTIKIIYCSSFQAFYQRNAVYTLKLPHILSLESDYCDETDELLLHKVERAQLTDKLF